MEIKIYSFFSGAGFLDLGFEDNGYNIVFVNEYEKNYLEIYKYSRQVLGNKQPNHGYYNCDIHDFLVQEKKQIITGLVEQDKKDSIVGFIGGPPCPDFSVAGKNKGIKGENGKLTNIYKRLIFQQMPDFFLFENVKGLVATKKHNEEYIKLKNAFRRKGYFLIDNLVNALEYGAPQDRERIILLGFNMAICNKKKDEMKKILDEHFNFGKNENTIEFIKERVWPTINKFNENQVMDMPEEILANLTVEYWFKKNDVCNHANSNEYFQPTRGNEKFRTILEGDVKNKSFKRLHRWRYSPTVAYGNNEVHLHPYKCRRLSVSEALALQSIPKEYEMPKEVALTVKFKTIGNGVPYLLGKGIARNLKDILPLLFEKYNE